MKITFLGTNGWYDTSVAQTTCVLIQTRRAHIICDAGGGFYKVAALIRDHKPIYLFLSHFHLDHILGLHALALCNFRQGIMVYGPPGTKRYLGRILQRPYTMPLHRLKTPVRLCELGGTPPRLPFKLGYLPLKHSVPCYGFRFTVRDKTVAYCTDTGVCRNLRALAHHADLFICECSFTKGLTDDSWPHLNPELAATAARDADAARLALIHFDAEQYPDQPQRKAAARYARMIFPHSFAAVDDQEVYV